MANIGDQLLQPEAGWKRYDDTHPAFKYSTGWAKSGTGFTAYAGAAKANSKLGANVKFDFTGTRLRIITRSTRNQSNSITVVIDGVPETISFRGANDNQVLVYEKTGLINKRHTVSVMNNLSGTQNWFEWDAIDINANGRLLHPDEVLTPDELEVGKRIRCHYSAQSGQVGTFSNLGQETYVDGINDFIPPESSATPDGDFYWIACKDENDKMYLLADRNLQTNVSYDSINSEGMTNTGREIKF